MSQLSQGISLNRSAKLSPPQLALYERLVAQMAPEELEGFTREIRERDERRIVGAAQIVIPQRRIVLGRSALATIVLPSLFLCLCLSSADAALISNWQQPSEWGLISDVKRGQSFSVSEAAQLTEIGFYLGNTQAAIGSLSLLELETEKILAVVPFAIGSHFDLEPYAVSLDLLLSKGDYAFIVDAPAYIGFGRNDFAGDSLRYRDWETPRLEVRPGDVVFYAMLSPSPLSEPNSCRLFMLNAGWILIAFGARGRALQSLV